MEDVKQEKYIPTVREEERALEDRKSSWELGLSGLDDEIADHNCSGALCPYCLAFQAAWIKLQQQMGVKK